MTFNSFYFNQSINISVVCVVSCLLFLMTFFSENCTVILLSQNVTKFFLSTHFIILASMQNLCAYQGVRNVSVSGNFCVRTKCSLLDNRLREFFHSRRNVIKTKARKKNKNMLMLKMEINLLNKSK